MKVSKSMQQYIINIFHCILLGIFKNYNKNSTKTIIKSFINGVKKYATLYVKHFSLHTFGHLKKDYRYIFAVFCMTDVILQVLPVKSIFIIFLTLSSLEPVKPGLPYYFGLFYELQNREKLLASWNYWGILCTSEAIGLHAPANRNQQVFLFTGIWFKVWFLVIIKNQFDLNSSAGSMGWLQVETWGKLLNYSTADHIDFNSYIWVLQSGVYASSW